MAALQEILYKAPILEIRGDISREIDDFHFDSRAIKPGSLFVAVRGTQTDGHKFIDNVIAQGAVAVVCEDFPETMPEQVTWVKVKSSAAALADISANFYGNPAAEIQVVGITGTNGKTTTATLLHKLFNAMGHKAGLLSTVAIKVGDEELPATHTTPDPKQLHANFRRMADAGCRYCFMEVSSHALMQERVRGVPFAGAVFTNITHDHLDYHGTFQAYIQAKQRLFDQLGSSAWALTNLDDRNGQIMVQNSKAARYTYGIKKVGDFKAKVVENTFEGLLLDLNGKEVWFRLIGSFNAYNLLAVYAAASLLGFEDEQILLELSRIEGVNGRFQTLRANGITAIVDYAHTPDALKNVLDTIRDIRTNDGRVITVVGCGGNRDKTKRPIMAKIAAELSDQVLLTSDNPRFEEPGAILDEMEAGLGPVLKRKALRIESRKEAIAVACRLAQPKDIILVAGKGHETYQEIQGVKHPFDDREELKLGFAQMGDTQGK